ncbi:helix-turn-helix domain-containing protein [Flavobacterium sp. LHD-85]|uniref:helix-turn-helix domain-containing protein n=1 Tax=Flavobacterium sp. LHD-85 TaxID=3071410 RepID=UPI0027E206EA|nr:helix-turn-helix domain-containing protein [Flavobacterium sp. LHD-85]MDQ6527691.1 helix-turn-helix domain-containing protein [Flavobacterium sp. LHD-85]
MTAQAAKRDLTKLPYQQLKNLFWENEKNTPKQFPYASAYLTKAKKENNPVEKARGCFLLSLLSESNKALRYLDSAIVYTKNLNDPKFPAYAYSGKGFVYKKQFKYKEAIDNFLIAENIAKKNNLDLYYDTKFSIAVLRSEELGEVKEALNLYKECLMYYTDKKVRSSQYSFSYQTLLFGLADAYKALNINDSATYYNKLGYFESKATKSNHINALFILNEGANKIFKGNFREALDSINKALPKIIFYKDKGNTLAAYYYTAKAYEGLDNKNEAVKNFIKVDSIYNINKRITPEFISGYPYLISHYKRNGDKLNQLKYLTKYMQIDSVLQNNYKELTKKLQKEYDTPYLIQEKENLIQSLKKENIISYWGIAFLILIIIITTGFGFYQFKLKKNYHKRFEKIMQRLAESNEASNQQKEQSFEINKSKTDTIGINEELINQILKKLAEFEKTKGFLDAAITIQVLSDTFETNNKYVSKIVNVYKEKTFIQYINDLRIEYALNSLKEKSKLRKYTIQALALEFGFNNAESFSAAFYKKTGIKPTYFIKQLEAPKTQTANKQ